MMKRLNVHFNWLVFLKELAMDKLVLVILASILAMPIAANAQIYKWKDKDGSVRYSDTPPPSNVQYESLGGKKNTPTQPAPAPAATKPAAEVTDKVEAKPQETPEQIAERKRIEEADAKARQQNCSAARANLRAFEQGGRISQVNEAGEREYLDDAALTKNAEQARKDIAEYCD